MKKIMSLVVLVGTVFVLGACNAQQQTTQQKAQETVEQKAQEKVQQTQENTEGVVKGTIKDLLGMNIAQKCTWSTDDVQGVVYIDDNKIRTEVKMLRAEKGQEAMGTEMNMINNGEWTYIWNNAANVGTKMKNDAMEEIAEDTNDMDTMDSNREMANNAGEIMNGEFNYKCVKWAVDKSKFIPPTNITFRDMSKMLENMQQMQQNMSENMKSVCDMLPPDQKEECLENM